ncbi:MAG: hypothetical protein LC798_10905 [Chloroflexi bacterium]|nr:hypothetical protein [Chloroflexota bacterium]
MSQKPRERWFTPLGLRKDQTGEPPAESETPAEPDREPPPRHPPSAPPPAPLQRGGRNSPRRLALVAAAAGAGVLLVGVLLFAIWPGRGLDEHAEKACASVEKSSEGITLEDRVIPKLTAIAEAEKSSHKELRAAANKRSVTSDLPFDHPLYENPADIRFRAIAAWCDKNA